MDNMLSTKIQEPSVMMEEVKSGKCARSVSVSSVSSLSSASSSSSKSKPWTKSIDNKKKPTTLPNETVEYLKAWIMSPDHIAHPYPTEVEKAEIMEETGLELKQLTNWFVNNRKRYWKPRVEARLQDQGKTSSPPIIKRDGSRLSLDDVAASHTSTSDVAPRLSRRRSSAGKRSPVRIISEQNSFASVSDGLTSSDDDEEETFGPSPGERAARELKTEETVDVHVLRPTSESVPDLSDVSVLQNIPSERILRTFESCALTYRYSDVKKAQSRRDAEIVRMKRHYLALYLAETACPENTEAVYHMTSNPSTPTKKRKNLVHVVPITPRPKYRRFSVDLWKEACQTADHVYDHDLPSLEEATRLFGYSL